MAVQTQIQTRRGDAATWTSTNPTLADGEIGFESDTNKFKIGTGSTAWASLPYAASISPLTTKGDLYTYSTADARLAVGNDGEQIVADSSTSTGLRYIGNYAAGKNAIINGDFYVNQRNFTSTTTTGTFGFDRWAIYNSGGTTTYSKESWTTGGNPVAGYNGSTYARVVTASQSAAGDYAFLSQKIENANTFSGQTVTISFWAKAASGTPQVAVALAPNQAGIGQVYTYGGNVTLSTSWARYSVTMSLGSYGFTAGYNELHLWTSAGSTYNSSTGSMGIQNATIDFWGVQVEAGSVATAFQTATGTIQGELAACQRYYWRSTPGGTYSSYASGSASSTTAAYFHCNFPVPMRVSPTSVDYSNLGAFDSFNGPLASTFIGVTYAGLVSATIQSSAASGLTQFRPYLLANNNNTAGYFGLSAEL